MNKREQRRKRKRTRRIVGWTIVGLVVVFAILAVLRNRAAGSATEAASIENARTYTVRLISDRDTIEVSGNVEPLAARDHSFTVSRELEAVTVEEGDTVSKGQILARVDDTQERYNLASLELTIEEERLNGSQRQLAVLELQRELRLADLEQTVLTSQLSGTVVEVNAEPGDRVAAGASLVRVIDTSSLIADVEINEYDLPLLAEGMPVEFTFDAIPDEVYTGRLSDIALEGRVNSQGLAVIDAVIRLDDPNPRIVPSYSFLAEIVVSDAEEVLAVEEAAIFDGPQSTIAFVRSDGDDRPVPTPVRIEALGNGLVRIVSGLEAGTTLVDPSVLAERLQAAADREPDAGGPPAGFGRALRPPGGGR
jgi:multidrug efflux pump subunit AcrA (membrane-fusion protein)